jgi:hypothetical protein
VEFVVTFSFRAMMSSVDWLRVDKIWLFLVLIRFCLVFLPQQGYIHPDEFFQSTEVIAGKQEVILGL